MYKSEIPPFDQVNDTRYKEERYLLLTPSSLEMDHDYILRLVFNRRQWGGYAVDHLVRVNDIDENKKRIVWPTVSRCVELQLLPLDKDIQVADKLISIQMNSEGAVYNQRLFDWRQADGGYLLQPARDQYDELMDLIMINEQLENDQSKLD